MLHLIAAAIATPCAFDETAAPASEAGLYHSQCYKFVGVATSLRECSEGGVKIYYCAKSSTVFPA